MFKNQGHFLESSEARWRRSVNEVSEEDVEVGFCEVVDVEVEVEGVVVDEDCCCC